jgi:uncharacterized protein (DUF302 family)
MNGLTTIESDFPFRETIERLISIVEAKGMTIFGRIDHAENAIKQGLALPPTELIIFGNPKAGTLLMQDKQIAGIDLPLKALACEDEHGKTWLTYNDTNWIAERHGLSKNSNAIVNAIAEGIAAIAASATETEK